MEQWSAREFHKLKVGSSNLPPATNNKEVKMKPFYVIIYNVNKRTFEPYNIMEYLLYEYNKESHKPDTYGDIKKFIKERSMYQFWSRCEYEIVLKDWPCGTTEEKWDVYHQIIMNIDTVTDVFIKNIH